MKLKHIFFTLAAVAFFSTAQAQVKVGANPGTIGTNSALEVEATNGKKVMVDKATGSVTIENAPAGVSSDSILTINASGVVRKVGSSTLKQNIGIAGAFRVVRAQSSQTIGTASGALMAFDTENYDELNEMEPLSGVFTVSQTGTWLLQARENFSVNTSSNQLTLSLQISTDGGATWRTASTSGAGPYAAGGGYTLDTSYSDYLTAGTKIRAYNATCNGCSTSAYVLSNQSFTGTRIR